MRTKYETILIAPDGGKFLLYYTPRASLASLVDCLRKRGAELCERLSIEDSAQCLKTRGGRFPALALGNGWSVRFSGRTELQARGEGELRWIFD